MSVNLTCVCVCVCVCVCGVFQSVLGAEGLSLAFRHIVSSLLWYCSQHSSEELLHEVIICVGYFTVNNTDNQVSPRRTQHPAALRSNAAPQVPFIQSLNPAWSLGLEGLCHKVPSVLLMVLFP